MTSGAYMHLLQVLSLADEIGVKRVRLTVTEGQYAARFYRTITLSLHVSIHFSLTNDMNRKMYERLGFQVVNSTTLPDGCVMLRMQRITFVETKVADTTSK